MRSISHVLVCVRDGGGTRNLSSHKVVWPPCGLSTEYDLVVIDHPGPLTSKFALLNDGRWSQDTFKPTKYPADSLITGVQCTISSQKHRKSLPIIFLRRHEISCSKQAHSLIPNLFSDEWFRSSLKARARLILLVHILHY